MGEKFTWNRYPSDLAEFEAFMTALDAHLSSEEVKPHQRPLRVGRKLWEAFGWGGNVLPPDALANEPGFEGEVLMAKAHRWYQETLGSRLKTSMEMGHIPLMLASTVWRLRIIEFSGTVNFFLSRNLDNRGDEGIHGQRVPSVNVLTLIDQLPQGLVDRLTDAELVDVFNFYLFAMRSLEWRNNLPQTPLLQVARGDFDSSSQEIFAGRYGQAKWAVQQAVEKTLKGLLTIGRTEFKTYGKEGHDLATLADTLRNSHRIDIDYQSIEKTHCSTHVRYANSSTLAEAVAANHAALFVFQAIKESDGFVVLMEEGQSAGRL